MQTLVTRLAAASDTPATSVVETTISACATTPAPSSVTAALTRLSFARVSVVRVWAPTIPRVALVATVLARLRLASVMRRAGHAGIAAMILRQPVVSLGDKEVTYNKEI